MSPDLNAIAACPGYTCNGHAAAGTGFTCMIGASASNFTIAGSGSPRFVVLEKKGGVVNVTLQ